MAKPNRGRSEGQADIGSFKHIHILDISHLSNKLQDLGRHIPTYTEISIHIHYICLQVKYGGWGRGEAPRRGGEAKPRSFSGTGLYM